MMLFGGVALLNMCILIIVGIMLVNDALKLSACYYCGDFVGDVHE